MKNSDIRLVVERLKQADLPHTEFVDLMENYKKILFGRTTRIF